MAATQTEKEAMKNEQVRQEIPLPEPGVLDGAVHGLILWIGDRIEQMLWHVWRKHHQKPQA